MELFLACLDAPVCGGPEIERTQGALRGVTTKVTCTVQAVPGDDIIWEWMKMRVDGTEEEIPSNLIKNQGLSSSILVTPLRQDDYGRLLCRAMNAVGYQQVPCIISLAPAESPEMPINCSATLTSDEEQHGEKQRNRDVENYSRDSILIHCFEGCDGGIKQFFLLEAWLDGQLLANLSRETPDWVLREIGFGVDIALNIFAFNTRGRSDTVTLEVHTSNYQHHADPEYRSFVAIAPFLAAVSGAVLILVVCVVSLKKSPWRPKKSEIYIPRPLTTAEVFDSEGVQSLQRQLSGLNKQEEESENCCLVSDEEYGENICSKRQLQENSDDRLHFASLPKLQKPDKNDYSREREIPRFGIPPSDDSRVSESESDSDVSELLSKRQLSSVVKKSNSKLGYTSLPSVDLSHFQKSSAAEHLTELSSSSGDSGVHSSPSIKLFSQFSSYDEKPETVISGDFQCQTSTLKKSFYNSQSLGENHTSRDKRAMASSLEFLPSPSTSSQNGLFHDKNFEFSKNKRVKIAHESLRYEASIAPNLDSIVIGKNTSKLLESEKAVTFHEEDQENLVFLRRSNPDSGNNRLRKNSGLAFTNYKVYELPRSFNASSSDLHCLGTPKLTNEGLRFNSRRGVTRNHISADEESMKMRTNTEAGLNEDKSSLKIFREPNNKFFLNSVHSERESSV
ncbi:hypothetical protein SK128_013391 [Halocaridina rubra]|uniref:Ig-like domain-containing protein n=1 Tax=Halocaridina rubra TaxID=373956 RepID=A0AAN9A4S3_HALRR